MTMLMAKLSCHRNMVNFGNILRPHSRNVAKVKYATVKSAPHYVKNLTWSLRPTYGAQVRHRIIKDQFMMNPNTLIILG